MTEQTQPTDAELEALAEEHLDAVHQFGRLWIEGQAAFARAVLAKWGTPAGAGEPVAYLDIGTGYLDLGTALSDDELLRLPKGRHALVIVGTYGVDGYTTPQPTKAQAGAPRVSPEQWQALFDDQKRLVELANSRADIAESMLKAVQEQAGAVPFNKTQRTNLFNNRDLASEKNMGVKLTLAEWHRIVQYIEAAHGIKGADHA